MQPKEIEVIYTTPPPDTRGTVINMGENATYESLREKIKENGAVRGYTYFVGPFVYLAILDEDKHG